MREGSLEAPTRHAIAWRDEAFYDPERIDADAAGVRYPPWLPPMLQSLRQLPASVRSRRLVAVRRGRGCRRGDFKRVVDACTLCDMCFMTKCPYVPPHPFDVDFRI